MSTTLRLGTRGSALALRQAATIKERLENRRFDVELVEVETTGDQITDEAIHELGKTGAFVRALDEEVIDGDCDAAVHSMKDMPTAMPEDMIVAGVPERAAPRDVLVTRDGATLDGLPEGATVGTSSLRRGAQLLAEREDLDVQPLRGNVDTRIQKLLAPPLLAEHERRVVAEADEEAEDMAEYKHLDDADDDDEDDEDDEDDDSEYDRTVEEWFEDLTELQRRALERDPDTEYDAIVLAEAGLERAGLLHHVEHRQLGPEGFVPAPSQGTLAVTARDGELAEDLRSVLDHSPTRVEATVERTVLKELGGGCVAPVGIYAVLQGSVVRTAVRVLDREGEEEVRETRELPVQNHAQAAREFAADLADAGAADLIEQARRTTGEESGAASASPDTPDEDGDGRAADGGDGEGDGAGAGGEE
ncbi:porphobilinogen deaminase [Halosimplex carlsbadense 2-9-1]|uniref:Hydroxymethylbilane synthase n=1 Tax=Halosimplex carlsbadense 2-9-1 TaxID=797114 RepID=M0D4Y2_9EURY|nr:hydroxymethylbilane synthase [Halosimplex carlsbadense]ELZ29239.1 porphobilinogen deaminase [Halosimplex carlsbadense 2-9-1]